MRDDAPARPGSPSRPIAGLLLALLVAGLAGSCSLRKMAVNTLASSLAESGDVFASDDDPDLVRDALPFALKTMESLLAEAPEHRDLLLASCRGFTGYAYAFVETDALAMEAGDYRGAVALRERALKLYLRARDYCLRALELDQAGVRMRLQTEPEAAVAVFPKGEVELLYWTAAAWGAAISLGKDRPELLADSAAVRALLRRALELDEGFDDGALHEALIAVEALPEAMGGSPARAREHFERAVELSGGRKASPFVTLAEQVSVTTQDRAEFEGALQRALEVDPDAEPSWRLVNRVAQRRARLLLERADELFLE